VELTAAQLRHLQRLADDARERRLLREHQSGYGKVASIPARHVRPSARPKRS
jgi:hypothetical protein